MKKNYSSKQFINQAAATGIAIFFCTIAFSQPVTTKADYITYRNYRGVATLPGDSKSIGPMTNDDKSIFFDKNIPSVIGKTGLAPAFFDNLSVEFGDDKINLAKRFSRSDDKRNSFGGQFSATAPNGTRTLFSPASKSPYDFDAQIKYTRESGGTKWYLLDNAGNPTTTISSVRNTWWNYSFQSGITKQILFSTDTLNSTRNPFTYELFISWNGLFNSFVIPRYIHKRLIWIIGAGFARYTNYSELDELTLRKGVMYNNQLLETETVSGRRSDYKVVNGFTLRGALYKPLTSPFALTNAHVGLTLSSFGLGTSTHLLNSTAGIYFSKWKSEDDDASPRGKVLKELFSLGIIGSFKNLQNVSKGYYAKDNFNIVVSAQIPLNFF